MGEGGRGERRGACVSVAYFMEMKSLFACSSEADTFNHFFQKYFLFRTQGSRLRAIIALSKGSE